MLSSIVYFSHVPPPTVSSLDRSRDIATTLSGKGGSRGLTRVTSNPRGAAAYFMLLLCVWLKLFRCRFVPLQIQLQGHPSLKTSYIRQCSVARSTRCDLRRRSSIDASSVRRSTRSWTSARCWRSPRRRRSCSAARRSTACSPSRCTSTARSGRAIRSAGSVSRDCTPSTPTHLPPGSSRDQPSTGRRPESAARCSLGIQHCCLKCKQKSSGVVLKKKWGTPETRLRQRFF